MPRDNVAKPPKGTTHVVLDTPAGLHGKRLKEVLKLAHKVVVPLQPSVFDIFATQDFLNELAARGLTVFNLAPERVARDLAQWQPICEWLDQ